MLHELRIIDFQAHARRRIKFSPSVTTIVGPSDAGKSSIIRALRWIALNEPAGLSHRRHDAKFVSAEILMDDRRVKRMRSDSENRYWLDAEEFASFGNDVPQPVQNFMAIGNHNFQCQHDSPYWLAVPGSQVSRELNQIIDLEIVDTVAACLTAKTRAAITLLDVVSSRLKTAEAEQKTLEKFPSAQEAFNRIKDQKKTSINKRQKSESMRIQVEAAEASAIRLAVTSSELDAIILPFYRGEKAATLREKRDRFFAELALLKSAYKDSRIVVPDLAPLAKLKNDAVTKRTKTAALRAGLDAWADAVTKTKIRLPDQTRMDALQDASERSTAIRAKYTALTSILEQTRIAYNERKALAAELEIAEKELADTPGICETCQRPLQS